nr:hypothetical protein P5665_08060 [Bacillus subtilis]
MFFIGSTTSDFVIWLISFPLLIRYDSLNQKLVLAAVPVVQNV